MATGNHSLLLNVPIFIVIQVGDVPDTWKRAKSRSGELQIDRFHSGTRQNHGMCPPGTHVLPHEGEGDSGKLSAWLDPE